MALYVCIVYSIYVNGAGSERGLYLKGFNARSPPHESKQLCATILLCLVGICTKYSVNLTYKISISEVQSQATYSSKGMDKGLLGKRSSSNLSSVCVRVCFHLRFIAAENI